MSCFTPNMVTFNSLIKGLCTEGRILEAARLFKKLNVFCCDPNVITFNTLALVALNLFEEMVNEFGVICKPDVVTCTNIIDGLCKDGFVDKAKELLLQMITPMFSLITL